MLRLYVDQLDKAIAYLNFKILKPSRHSGEHGNYDRYANFI